MNTMQRYFLLMGVIAVVVLCLVVPWQEQVPRAGRLVWAASDEATMIFVPPRINPRRVDLARWAILFAGICATTTALVLACARQRKP